MNDSFICPFSHPACFSYHQMKCCGWSGPGNWSDNLSIKNSTKNLYPCSCRNDSLAGTDVQEVGLCEHMSTDLPVYETVYNLTSLICLIDFALHYEIRESEFSVEAKVSVSVSQPNSMCEYISVVEKHHSVTSCKNLSAEPSCFIFFVVTHSTFRHLIKVSAALTSLYSFCCAAFYSAATVVPLLNSH